jgi:two-component system nitrate/nitrite response regulator NarP
MNTAQSGRKPTDSNDETSICLVATSRMISEAIQHFLKNEYGFNVFVAGSINEVRSLVADGNIPDVILLDPVNTGIKGLDALSHAAHASSDSKIVLFTHKVDTALAKNALNKGVDGIISHGQSLRSLVNAIGLIQSGEVFIPSNINSDLHHNWVEPARPRNEALTHREKRILQLASDGGTNKEIAQELGITESQVKMIMRTLCAKLQAKNRTHAVVRANRLDLI